MHWRRATYGKARSSPINGSETFRLGLFRASIPAINLSKSLHQPFAAKAKGQ